MLECVDELSIKKTMLLNDVDSLKKNLNVTGRGFPHKFEARLTPYCNYAQLSKQGPNKTCSSFINLTIPFAIVAKNCSVNNSSH